MPINMFDVKIRNYPHVNCVLYYNMYLTCTCNHIYLYYRVHRTCIMYNIL